jgi:hypothetical protein
MRFRRLLLWVIGCLIAVAIGLEGGARFVLQKKPLTYSTSYDPIFVSGDVLHGRTRDQLTSGANGPAIYDYGATMLGHYQWNGDVAPHSLTTLSDFLFANPLSLFQP